MKFRARRTTALKMGQTVPDAWRFGEGRTCWWCGRRVLYGATGDPLQATREHLVPRSVDGTGARSNIVVACAQCNNHRQSRQDWAPFHRLNDIGVHIPRHQWEHLQKIGCLPTRVMLKKGKTEAVPS